MQAESRALSNQAVSLVQLNRFTEALELLEKSVLLNPTYAFGWKNRAALLLNMGRIDAAAANYDLLLKLQPDVAEHWHRRAQVMTLLNRRSEAIADLDRALELAPASHEAWMRRGNLLFDIRRYEDAAESFERAASLDEGDKAGAHFNRANSLRAMGRLREAMESYLRAVQLRDMFPDAWNNLGLCCGSLGRTQEAKAALKKALSQSPKHAGALNNLGDLHIRAGEFEEAIGCYEQLHRLQPDYKWVEGLIVGLRMQRADWDGLQARCDSVKEKAMAGKSATYPFPALGWLDDPAAHRRMSETYTAERHPADPFLGPITKSTRRDRIRIGYFSADFHEHATAWLTAGLFENHDRFRFEIIGFSFGSNRETTTRRRLMNAFDQFLDVSAWTDAEIARKARELGIDIAVDLKGFTQDARPGIFALRAAPVQVDYLGYPGTMGAPYMDYLIADAVVIPDGQREHYCEKLIVLPHSYQVNDDKREIASTGATRPDHGLPETGFVFASFNNTWKITPELYDSWMRIMAAVEGSVLWLLGGDTAAEANLRKETAHRGIDPARIVFGSKLPVSRHLERLTLADLVLDNYPYNAHTTASDALWAGVPVLSRPGTGFASRVAASLLKAVGMPETIVETTDAYETMAIDLARDSARMRALKEKLWSSRATSPLFDTSGTTRAIEKGFVAAFERAWKGLPPDHIDLRQRAETPQESIEGETAAV